jgi:hypothetical protein
MHITRFTLELGPGGPPPSQECAELVRDLVWAHALPETGLEHVTAIPVTRGIHVALFQRQDVGDPAARLRDLVESMLRPSELAGRAALQAGGRPVPVGAPALRSARSGRVTASRVAPLSARPRSGWSHRAAP